MGHTGRVIAALAGVVLACAGLACGRGRPAKNTQTDLIAFSHIDKAWPYSKGAGVTVAGSTGGSCECDSGPELRVCRLHGAGRTDRRPEALARRLDG
jgi:hypothetical protein